MFNKFANRFFHLECLVVTFFNMKQIVLFWWLFILIFFGTVILGYTSGLDSDFTIVLLLAIYGIFQGFFLWRAFKYGRDWVVASIVLQAVMATGAPLYFSNFGDPVYEYVTGTWFDSTDSLDPCQLCWWARIMMFPIVPLSLIVLFTKSRAVLGYIYAITFPGMILEAFHYILQKPGLIGKATIDNPFWCTAANPCSALSVDYFGFITIPLLCFLAFLIINIFAMFALFSKKIEKATK